jgi:hypothetical protein
VYTAKARVSCEHGIFLLFVTFYFRPSHRDMTIYLQDLAVLHASEELVTLGVEVDDACFETIGDTLSYQCVVCCLGYC